MASTPMLLTKITLVTYINCDGELVVSKYSYLTILLESVVLQSHILL